MQILLTATTILVLFAYAKEQVAQITPDWLPLATLDAATP